MRLHTCSEVISFAKQLEGESANFYENLAQKYVNDKDLFLSFSKDNERTVKEIERVYYGVITDAIEGCFAFAVDTDEYTFETSLAPNARYHDALDKALEMERRIIKFYSDAAEQGKVLMADVPRAFKLVAKKRDGRRPKLRSLLENKG